MTGRSTRAMTTLAAAMLLIASCGGKDDPAPTAPGDEEVVPADSPDDVTDDGAGGEPTDGVVDFSIPRVTSSFMFTSDDGVCNTYANDLGMNTYSLLEPGWGTIEAVRGEYQFDDRDFVQVVNHQGPRVLRLSLFDRLWCRTAIEPNLAPWMIEMLFGQPTVPESYTEHDTLNITDEFIDAYQGFFAATLAYTRAQGIEFDLILLEMEINGWAQSTQYGSARAVAYLGELCEIVPQYYPDAHVGVILATNEYAPWYTGEEGDLERIGARPFAERMIAAGIDFDTIAFRFTPDIYEAVPASYYEQLLAEMAALGKYLYIWTAWFAADPTSTLGAEPHTEETQRDEVVDFLRASIEHPMVIGVNLPLVDYFEGDDRGGSWMPIGLVDGGPNQQYEPGLRLRPAYTALQEFWTANHPD